MAQASGGGWLIKVPALGTLRREDAKGAELIASDAVGIAVRLALEPGLKLCEFSLLVLLGLTPALAGESFDHVHETLGVVGAHVHSNSSIR